MHESRRIVTNQPENSETPLDQLRSWVTPNRLFFVRDHFDVPPIDVTDWQLRVEGCVERPATITWDELTSMPVRSVFATGECAGNGRSFLQPSVHGVQWGAGAIGHAEWTGVPLKLVLERAGVQTDAVEVVCYGADQGTESDHPEPMNFARGLPLPKALHPDTLLAYRMNGELLDANHGYPLRLLVPGWYGVASVKWLTRIEAVATPFEGYFQTRKYTYQRSVGDRTESAVVGPMVVKSEIIRPRAGDVLGIGTNRVFGVAWAGENAVSAVEISVDGGSTWNDAQLLGPRSRYSWCLWEYLWDVAQPGEHSILVRAVDSTGAVQPEEHDRLRGGYMINFIRTTSVCVKSSRETRDQPDDAEALLYDMNAFAEDISRMKLDVEVEFTAGAGI